jgi:hypothetical protein
MDFKKLKKKSLRTKGLRLLPNVCDSKKKTIPKGTGMDLKSIENL